MSETQITPEIQKILDEIKTNPELRTILRKELDEPLVVNPAVTFRRHIESELARIFPKRSRHYTYQVQGAIYCLVKTAMRIPSVSKITHATLPEAIDRANWFLSALVKKGEE
jgi:hypothetical protein